MRSAPPPGPARRPALTPRSARVARVTALDRLDRLGVPVVSAMRADPLGESVSVCTGKARTAAEARRNALAEAWERWCAEPRGHLPVRYAPVDAPPGRAVDPRALHPAPWAPPTAAPIGWVAGVDLGDGRRRWVPAEAAFFPWFHPTPWFAPSTNGLAAGASPADACARALLEAVERHAVSVALAAVAAGDDAVGPAPAVVSAWARRLSARASREGLAVRLRDLTGPLGVPVAQAVVHEDDGSGVWAHLGWAARPTLEAAVDAALLEALQSRLVDIQGAREDLPAAREAPHPWFLAEPLRVAARPDRMAIGRPAALVREIRARLAAAGLPAPVVVRLDRRDGPLPVVRVVAPGLRVDALDPERAPAGAPG